MKTKKNLGKRVLGLLLTALMLMSCISVVSVSAAKSELELLQAAVSHLYNTVEENNVLDSKKDELHVISMKLLEMEMNGSSSSNLELVQTAISKYSDDLNEGLADGTWIKADYTAVDGYIAELDAVEDKPENITVNLEAIKEELSELKENPETSKADLAVLEEKALMLQDCLEGNHSFTSGICVSCGSICKHENVTDCICSSCYEAVHSSDNGFCTGCDVFESATLTTDKYDVDGDGVKDEVYEISNAGQLYWFADKVNNENANFGSANAVLTDNILVNEGVLDEDGNLVKSDSYRVWKPIGNEDNIYTGSFDGQNHQVSGLFMDDSNAFLAGLFGYVYKNTIKNVGVVSSYIKGESDVGGVVGFMEEATVENCYNTGTVIGDECVGGVVAIQAYGLVTECYNTGSISGINYVGGIVGTKYAGDIKYCYNTGTVSGDSRVGGIVGENRVCVKNCYNVGTVSGSYFVGGIVGESGTGSVSSFEITACYYLDTSCDGGINGEDTPGCAETKTLDEFMSGEVAYFLQEGIESQYVYDESIEMWVEGEPEHIWGQKIGEDNYPVLGGDKVYEVKNCKGETAYNNTEENIGHNYVSGKCTVCGEADPSYVDKLIGYNISLGDKISVNYYLRLTEATLNDENAKVVFEVPDSRSTYTLDIPVKDGEKEYGGNYIFRCEVAAKEMTSAISAKLVTSGSELQLEDYTVQQYAEYILSNSGTYANEQELVKAMLNYGAQAQLYFNYNTDNLANDTEYMTEDDKKIELYGFAGAPYTLEGEEEGVTYYGSALSLKSEVAFKHYFIIDESVDFESLEITCDYPATIKKNGNLYELIISDIPAHRMGENSIKVTLGGITLDYTIYSYGALAQSAGKTELWTMVSALTRYANAASEY